LCRPGATSHLKAPRRAAPRRASTQLRNPPHQTRWGPHLNGTSPSTCSVTSAKPERLVPPSFRLREIIRTRNRSTRDQGPFTTTVARLRESDGSVRPNASSVPGDLCRRPVSHPDLRRNTGQVWSRAGGGDRERRGSQASAPMPASRRAVTLQGGPPLGVDADIVRAPEIEPTGPNASQRTDKAPFHAFHPKRRRSGSGLRDQLLRGRTVPWSGPMCLVPSLGTSTRPLRGASSTRGRNRGTDPPLERREGSPRRIESDP
jgi:hypothetical protein